MTAQEIIIEARNKKGWSQSVAAEKLGEELKQTYSLRQYQRLEDGEFPKYKREIVRAIEKILNIDIYDIIYDKNIPREIRREDFGPSYMEQRKWGKILGNEIFVPLIPYKARAGYSRNYENVDYIDNEFETYQMPPGVPHRGADWRWFEVGGSSMLPTLTDGDYLLCSLVPVADWLDIEQFKIHVIVWKSEVSVKRAALDGQDYILISENEADNPQKRISINDIKEVWKVRRRITANLPPIKRFKITV